MTREEARKAAEVMLAYADGKEIEYRPLGLSIWRSTPPIIFDWGSFTYRVKKRAC